ncbi:Uncharacterized protein HZ326_18199 [Fusarium oxysporum f. sp. albedinis]|nr:Uncharacterized protein HZ326_18199 [Fusarium oxysporum f. sp. albedinis]
MLVELREARVQVSVESFPKHFLAIGLISTGSLFGALVKGTKRNTNAAKVLSCSYTLNHTTYNLITQFTYETYTILFLICIIGQ